jgi:cAMP-dependent protein kinase regulator
MLRHRLDAKMRVLSQVPFFDASSPQEQLRLARATDVVPAEQGEVLIREGRAGYEFFVILSGTAEVVRDGEHVAFLEPGQCFGELSLLDGRARCASVIARTRMSLAVVDARAFRVLLAEAPTFARAVLRHVAGRARDADTRALAS